MLQEAAPALQPVAALVILAYVAGYVVSTHYRARPRMASSAWPPEDDI